mmetsp:Transcript_20698/g.60199  ORF Transcript_20698/g.60199 Transcript_20698/m.60199 type:complete len:206 (-) Transcript_20698:274-891(-)
MGAQHSRRPRVGRIEGQIRGLLRYEGYTLGGRGVRRGRQGRGGRTVPLQQVQRPLDRAARSTRRGGGQGGQVRGGEGHRAGVVPRRPESLQLLRMGLHPRGTVLVPHGGQMSPRPDPQRRRVQQGQGHRLPIGARQVLVQERDQQGRPAGDARRRRPVLPQGRRLHHRFRLGDRRVPSPRLPSPLGHRRRRRGRQTRRQYLRPRH